MPRTLVFLPQNELTQPQIRGYLFSLHRESMSDRKKNNTAALGFIQCAYIALSNGLPPADKHHLQCPLQLPPPRPLLLSWDQSYYETKKVEKHSVSLSVSVICVFFSDCPQGGCIRQLMQ